MTTGKNIALTRWTFVDKVMSLIFNMLSRLEKAMAPHSSTFAWKIPWAEEPGRLQSMGSPESDTTERLHFHFSLSCIGEGNGNPLQCFCLENPRDGGAWWAAVYGVAESWTQLKRLSSSSSRKTGQAGEIRVSGEVESSLWMLTCGTTIGPVCRSL